MLAALWAAVCCGCAGRSASAEPAEPERFEFKRVCMGVQTRVILYAAEREAAEAAANAAYDEIGRLEQIMSDYRPSSELSRLNARAGGGPVEVSPELFEILSLALEVSERSGGAFDVTVGPLVTQWREARRAGRLASEDERAAAMALVGWRNVEMDERAKTVRLGKAGMKVDLGGIGKGHAAQRAVDVLKALGMRRCLVALSGDIAVGEAPVGREGWEIEVEGGHIGHAEEDGVRRLLLTNAAVSTSGDTEQFIEIDGRRYSHIVDARTGLGTAGGLSVTVVAERGAIADAMSTAVCVMGAEEGARLVRSWKGTAAVLEEKKGEDVVRTVVDPGGWMTGAKEAGR